MTSHGIQAVAAERPIRRPRAAAFAYFIGQSITYAKLCRICLQSRRWIPAMRRYPCRFGSAAARSQRPLAIS